MLNYLQEKARKKKLYCDATGKHDVPRELWHDPDDDEDEVGDEEDGSDGEQNDVEYGVSTFNVFDVLARGRPADVQSPVRSTSQGDTECSAEETGQTDVYNLVMPNLVESCLGYETRSQQNLGTIPTL